MKITFEDIVADIIGGNIAPIPMPYMGLTWYGAVVDVNTISGVFDVDLLTSEGFLSANTSGTKYALGVFQFLFVAPENVTLDVLSLKLTSIAPLFAVGFPFDPTLPSRINIQAYDAASNMVGAPVVVSAVRTTATLVTLNFTNVTAVVITADFNSNPSFFGIDDILLRAHAI
jgi:hypothetical protein